MMKKEYCFNCNKDVIVNKKIRKNKYKINGEEFEIEELVYICSNCKNEIDVEGYDSIKNIYDEYLKLYDLTFDDFKSIRKKYNLSHDLFAKLLGWSKRTIIRYEQEKSFPQKQYIEMYSKLKKGSKSFLSILNDNKQRLKDDYYIILEKSKLYTHMKTLNSFLFMLNDNPLYKTSIMKNMFALDFYHNKMYGQPLTNLSYAKADHGPIIDNHKEIIDYLLEVNSIKKDIQNDDRIVFSSDVSFDETFFSKEELESMEYIKNKLKGKTASELSNWSHEFLGWQETSKGHIIDFKKYRNDFNIENI